MISLHKNNQEHGFTLIEVLMALTVFALISVLAYSTIDTAGRGFETLTEVRLVQEKSGWIGKQLRQDMRYLTSAPHIRPGQPGISSGQNNITPIRIQNDNRGEVELDELWLLVYQPGQYGITQVHYYIDEDNNHLIRESRLLLARAHIEPVRWDFGNVHSWSIEIWDRDGNWRQDWNFNAQSFVWPKAVKINLQIDDRQAITSQRQWLMAVLPEQTL
ncbi:MAG: prepilin-type N-terminal cleavage/methylation domain-containing protein [Mariprofundus sp.]|nr:prepilin-type N-terminal cleavage/methylation domain-containing protein [Mariprofundus sp.]